MWRLRRSARRAARGRKLATALALCTLAGLPACAAAGAAAPSGEDQARLDRTVRFLQEVQNPDGGFGGVRGGESDPDFSAWVALALAAAGINPQDQSRSRGDVDAYTYLANHSTELSTTTDFERVLLVADAAGTPARSFGGRDLVAAILQRQLPDGSFEHIDEGQPAINDTVFAILALAPVHEPGVSDAVERAVNWLEGEQIDDGSWSSNCPKTLPSCSAEAEVDMTGAAVEALTAAGRRGSTREAHAFAFLRAAQDTDGGFSEKAAQSESNVASTAWAVQGMWAGGENPEDAAWTKSGINPLGYMASLQQSDGSIRFKVSEDAIPVWMTAYVAPAFAGQALPIPPVARRVEEAPSPARSSAPGAPAPNAAKAGQGGESDQAGGGVIAGGGGNGAALFSRPKPQSRGRSRGGARQLDDSLRRAAAGPLADLSSTGARTRPRPFTSDVSSSKASERTASASATNGSHAAEVDGLLIADARAGPTRGVAAAPGLRSAAAGGDGSAWLSIAIGVAIALFAAAGAVVELKRPQMVL